MTDAVHGTEPVETLLHNGTDTAAKIIKKCYFQEGGTKHT